MGLAFWAPEFELLRADERADRADFQSPYYWDHPIPELAEEHDDGLFHVSSPWDSLPVKTLVCKACAGVEFNVGVGSNFTAIRCPRCGWEKGVRDF